MRHALAVMVALAGGAAHAETKADALFKKGKQQLAEKKYAEACATFEKVDKLDPGIGAKLNAAKCFEEWGKLAKAYVWFADAEKMAKDTSDKRAPKIKALADALDADVPRLTITLPASVDAATAAVRLDGTAFPADQLGKEQRVDPGAHDIDYIVKGVPRKKSISIEKGASTEVELKFDGADKASDPKDPNHPVGPPPPSPAHNWRKISGIAVGSAGIVGLGISGILTLGAHSDYKEALAAHCRGATNMCDEQGIADTKSARHRANIATVVSVISAVAIAGGVVLFVTAPKPHREEHALYLAPAISDTGAAVILGGGF